MINLKMCEDCTECKKIKGVSVCHEMFDKPLTDLDECPFEFEETEVQELETKAKENKIKHGAKSETKKERKPKERKPDIEKEELIQDLAEFLKYNSTENVVITNKTKLIEFDLGENHYKLDLIRQRKKKKVD